MSRSLKGTLLVVGLALVAGGIVWSFLAHRNELAEEGENDEPVKNGAQVTQSSSGETVVRFDRTTQQRMGIRTEALSSVSRTRQVAAYGQLEEDPSRSFILRAPVAGTVRGTGGTPWPDTGQILADRSRIGAIEPRLAPADRITLGDRLAGAKADVESTTASVAAARAALERARTLNAEDKNVSDKALQEAESHFTGEQARLTAAKESVMLIEAALRSPGPASSQDGALPLELERGGQVVEVLAHPGESVESGQPVLRVSRFDLLLARVDVPAGETVAAALSKAEILPLGRDGHPVEGTRVALAASVDPKTQGQPFLFSISDPAMTLRPGLAVTAWLDVPGAPRKGVVVPQPAVVRQSGRSWAYVQTADQSFARRPVALEEPAGDGWFTKSLSPGDRVVVTGAQTLLSEEFKSQIQVGDEDQ